LANDNFHALKLSPDLIHLEKRASQKRAEELDRLCNQEIGHSTTRLTFKVEEKTEGYLQALLKKFTRNRSTE
jgi:hypothetical protein